MYNTYLSERDELNGIPPTPHTRQDLQICSKKNARRPGGQGVGLIESQSPNYNMLLPWPVGQFLVPMNEGAGERQRREFTPKLLSIHVLSKDFVRSVLIIGTQLLLYIVEFQTSETP